MKSHYFTTHGVPLPFPIAHARAGDLDDAKVSVRGPRASRTVRAESSRLTTIASTTRTSPCPMQSNRSTHLRASARLAWLSDSSIGGSCPTCIHRSSRCQPFVKSTGQGRFVIFLGLLLRRNPLTRHHASSVFGAPGLAAFHASHATVGGKALSRHLGRTSRNGSRNRIAISQ